MSLRVILTGSIAVGAIVAAMSGTSVLAARNASEAGVEATPATPVQATQLELIRYYDVERRFTGAFEAAQESAVAFELGGKLVEVLVDEGDRVSKGDVLARLDTQLLEQEKARLEAARDGLEANAELARRTNARQEKLKERGFATAQRVDDTSLNLLRIEAAIAETDAAIASVDVQLAKAVLRSPFSGQISARFADEGAVTGGGTPVFRVLEDASPRFRVGLAPDLADTISVGDTAVIKTASGETEATLTHLAPRLDEATRARTAFFTPTSTGSSFAGQTGEIVLTSRIRTEFDGAWVPIEALRQGPRGSWTVLTVEGEGGSGVAGIAAVEIIHVETERAFVRGTFSAESRLVETGPHRVVPGEPVTILSDQEVLSWAR